MSKDKLRPLMKAVADLPEWNTGLMLDIITELNHKYRHPGFESALKRELEGYRQMRESLHWVYADFIELANKDAIKAANIGKYVTLPPKETGLAEWFVLPDENGMTSHGKRRLSLRVANVTKSYSWTTHVTELIDVAKRFEDWQEMWRLAATLLQESTKPPFLLHDGSYNHFFMGINGWNGLMPVSVKWSKEKSDWEFRDPLQRIEPGDRIFAPY